MPAPLFKQDEFVEDIWTFVEDDTKLPRDSRHVVVSLDRWLRNQAQIIEQYAGVGVALNNTDDVLALDFDVDVLDLFAIEFPAFVDGRGYSQAHLLRERLGFTGEIRARGEVFVDQLFLLKRSGFDAFELSPTCGSQNPASYLKPYSATYQ